MQDILGESLRRLKKKRIRRIRALSVLLILSLLVSMDVFWFLRQPGLTLAGNADCGYVEHIHDEDCYDDGLICGYEEHVHNVGCYSHHTEDQESLLDWQKMFADYPYTGNLREDLVGIAKTQVGYAESQLNFEVGNDGIRRGYTRYGAWYGTPYRDWSAMFVSFCLSYAGADSQTHPGNAGANTMAQLWNSQGKYAVAGDYTPVRGDLVFFADNTVGIVAEAFSSTIYVIRGDVEDAVKGAVISMADETIVGWGITGEISTGKKPSTSFITLTEEMLDISNGPAVFISVGGEENQTNLRQTTYSLRNTRTIIDLLTYLNNNNGSYFYTLLDKNNHEVPKDANGNFLVEEGVKYKLTLSVSRKDGFPHGTYQHQLPEGVLVDGGTGKFELKDGTEIGNWSVTDDGLITITFNEHMDSRSDIIISVTAGIMFPPGDTPIDFDGNITVTIQKPSEEDKDLTHINKWGTQGSEEDEKRPNKDKLYWTIQVIGNKDSNIPGSTLTDRIVLEMYSNEHSYTESDIAAGILVRASEIDLATGLEVAWHKWHISLDDLEYWDENGWSYIIPEKVVCEGCGEILLGNEGWTYTFEYTTTPNSKNFNGALSYKNHVEVDNQGADGWGSFSHGEVAATIDKVGSFIGEADGGFFLWEIQTTIPGRKDGERAEYAWYIWDEMSIVNPGNYSDVYGYTNNNLYLSKVTATYNGITVDVPRIQDVTNDSKVTWHNGWNATSGDKNVSVQLELLCHCDCTEETCAFWGEYGCTTKYWYYDDYGQGQLKEFCHCWTTTENITLTFVYETKDISVVEKYGSQGALLRNKVDLYNRHGGSAWGIRADASDSVVKIPNVFQKVITKDFDGYLAHYRITVNEGKLVLTDGSPLIIRDEMSTTMSFISGTLVIKSQDGTGKEEVLRQDVDYTISYNGSGGAVDDNGASVHLLEIILLHPQPVTYIIDYDTTLIISNDATHAIKYTNSANITLWGQKVSKDSEDKYFADINVASKSYRVDIIKTANNPNQDPLRGAKFGIFNDQGGLIDSDVTNADGKMYFQTSLVEGIILQEHVLYYIQELNPPLGYQLDDTKFWFCFCDQSEDSCEQCQRVLEGKDNAFRIPFEQTGMINVKNTRISYDLPATGGPGIYPIVLGSVVLILTPLIYRFIVGRKRERRSG